MHEGFVSYGVLWVTKEKQAHLKIIERRSSELPTRLYVDHDASVNDDIDFLLTELKSAWAREALVEQNKSLNNICSYCYEPYGVHDPLCKASLEDK